MILCATGNQLTSLDVTENTVLIELYCSNNQLSTDALNTLFNTINSNSNNLSNKYISIEKNPGTDACDRNIAVSKGWIFVN